jgi:hypothetical protein
MFPLSQKPLRQEIGDLQRELDDLLAERSELESLLKSNKVVPAASQMVEDLQNCSELFSRLMGALSSSPMKITFPLSRPFQERLVKLISDFKEKTNDLQRQIDGVLSGASTLGFRGSRLSDAVDFIVSSFVESEKQQLGERMHAELMAVRRVNETERELAQKQRQKAKKRVAELRGTLGAMHQRNATIEDELRGQLDAEKRKGQQAMTELEKERRIHEELMLVIGGKAADSEYLRSKLSEREMKELVKAQEIRTFIDQMQAKQAEEQRLLDLACRNRKDTFRRPSIRVKWPSRSALESDGESKIYPRIYFPSSVQLSPSPSCAQVSCYSRNALPAIETHQNSCCIFPTRISRLRVVRDL